MNNFNVNEKFDELRPLIRANKFDEFNIICKSYKPEQLFAVMIYIGRDGSTLMHYLGISDAPYHLFEFIINSISHHGQILNIQNMGGCLPLHIASWYSSSVDVVSLLYNTYPQAADVKDEWGETPLDRAKKHNNTNGKDAIVTFLTNVSKYNTIDTCVMIHVS